MKFFVNPDVSRGIHFWIAPDNNNAISRVYIVVDGRRVAEISAWLFDDQIRSSGWHSTGQCMFRITDAEVPEISGADRLEILDADTNVLIFRSVRNKEFLRRKVLFAETSIKPNRILTSSLFDRFQYSYSNINRLPEETISSILGGPWLTSSLICGSILFPRYEGYFSDENSLTSIIIHDPYIEMARRLLWLKSQVQIALDASQKWRVGDLLESVIFIADYNFDNPKDISRFFQLMPEKCYYLLYNPLCRQFGTSTPGERFSPAHSITAMEVISRSNVVGHSNFFEAFYETLTYQLGIDDTVPVLLPIENEIRYLSKQLQSNKVAQSMVSFDVAISDAVSQLVESNWRQ